MTATETCSSRHVWLTLEEPEIIELKQVMLDRDVEGAAAFFRRVVAPRVREAARMALKGLLRPGDHVVTSSIEHNALWRPLKALERTGVRVTAVRYQSLTTIPTELREAGATFRFDGWLRFKTLELPFGAISLLWNSMMSWAGGTSP